jgi:hypothetical protein
MDLSVTDKIDFTPVGATNLKPLDVSDALIKEKLSFLILDARMKDPTYNPRLKYNEYEHAQDNYIERMNNAMLKPNPHFTVERNNKKYGLSLKDLHHLSFFEIAEKWPKLPLYQPPPVCISIKPGADFENISVFDAVRKEEACSETKRIDELLHLYQIERDAYAPFSIHSSRFRFEEFLFSLEDTPKTDRDGFILFQRQLGRWFTAGFPRSYTVWQIENRPDPLARTINLYIPSPRMQVPLPDPVFYPPIGTMAFDIVEPHHLPQMRLYRLFLNPDNCGLRRALIPVVSVQEKIEKNWIAYNVMTHFPKQEKIPLYNLRDVASPKVNTIVICGCIEDAHALQEANASLGHVAFTSFVSDNMDRTDWSPLAKKSVIILISGDKNKALNLEFERAKALCEYLCGREDRSHGTKIAVDDIGFVFRQVEFPDSSAIATPADLASAYYHNPPHVVGNVKPMDEAEFSIILEKLKASCSILPPWEMHETIQPETKKRRLEEDFLVRGFLYKGAITELCSKAGAGKTHIALAAGRYVVAGDKPFLEERFWTRCKDADKTVPKKVVYWGGSDVSVRDIHGLNMYYKEGLSDAASENFFIELAPKCMTEMTLDLKAYKNALMEYTYRGEYGQSPDLLIIDHLSDIAGEKKIYEALSFLSKLKKEFPDLSILVLHHLADPGNIRKGSEAKMKPRVIIVINRIEQEQKFSHPSAQRVWEFRYEKQNVQLSDIEVDYPFSVTCDTDGGYTVDSICSKKDFGKLIAYHYRKDAYPKRTVEEVANLMGCSKSNVEKSYTSKQDEINRIYEAFIKNKKR